MSEDVAKDKFLEWLQWKAYLFGVHQSGKEDKIRYELIGEVISKYKEFSRGVTDVNMYKL